jgi:hypothetical protein
VLTRRSLGRFVVPLGAILLAGAGCSSPTGSSEAAVDVAGSWVGTVQLPNPYSATLSLQQSGASVSGTMRIAGVMKETPLTGSVSSSDRTLAWTVNRSCEAWTGRLTIDGSGRHMDGQLAIDRTGCQPAQSNETGTLSVDMH